MHFRQNILSWPFAIARRMSWLVKTSLNVSWYYFFHRKFFPAPDSQTLWEKRRKIDFEQIAAVEKDPYYQKFSEYIFQRLKGFNSQIYLEIGCYYGYRLNKFTARLGDKKFIGLDMGLQNLLWGKGRIINNANVDLINANACALPFKDNKLETVYTVVCLTHVDYSLINKVIDEIVRICAKNLLLIEADHRYMKLTKKLDCLNWRYGYMHPYEKMLAERMNLISVTPLYDLDHHPRYTAFQFVK